MRTYDLWTTPRATVVAKLDADAQTRKAAAADREAASRARFAANLAALDDEQIAS